MRILGSELEGVVKTAIWLIHVHAHFLVAVSPSSPLTTKFNLGLIQPSPDFSLALGPLPGAHVEAKGLMLVAA
jgi:hypothetical protein